MASLASTSQTSLMFNVRSRFQPISASSMRELSSRRQTCLPNCRRKSQGTALSCRRKSRGLQVNAMMDEGELVPDVDEGTRVKITKEIIIYHAPKTKELQLQGMEGSVKSIVKKYKGKETSANLPYRIEFLLEKDDGKQQKFFAHLAASEFEKIY